jgi:hypothetical protein
LTAQGGDEVLSNLRPHDPSRQSAGSAQ